MATLPVFLGNGHYRDYSLTVSSQQCVNLWPMYPQTESITEAVLYNTPGRKTLVDLGDTEIGRGQIEFNDKFYTVSGNTLYLIDRVQQQDGSFKFVPISIPGEISGEGRVFIVKNTSQICIVVPGLISYIFSEADGLQEITDPNFLGPALGVVYIDSFFVFVTNNNTVVREDGRPVSIIFQSDSENGLSYDPTKFGTAEMDPDKIVAPFVFNNQLYVFGTEVTEVYDNIGGPGFVFQRNEGYMLDKGLAAAFSVVENEESFMFLGGSRVESPAIWRVEGNAPTKVSTSGEDTIIQRYSPESLATTHSMAYSMDGGCFAVFTFPEDTTTFDIYSSRAAGRPIWHRQHSVADEQSDRWHVHDITKVYGIQVATDSYNGMIGHLSMDVFTDNGEAIKRTFSSPTVYAGPRGLIISRLEIIVEAGTSPDETESIMTMTVSSDGGKTWGNRRRAGAGSRGQNHVRLIWYGLGWHDQFFNFRLQWWADAKLVILDAQLTYHTKQQAQQQ